MLLTGPYRRLLVLATLSLVGIPVAQAQAEWQLETTVQLGVDAWHIDHEHPDRRGILFLADAMPKGPYRSQAPWATFQNLLHLGELKHVVLRARANQDNGASVDQLYYDHAISPNLGFRLGVADYRATWCREYDTDNPWVRESDPFCTNRQVRKATSSAPALQAYVNFDVNHYQVQGIAGLYRPRALGYEPKEFGDYWVEEDQVISKNHKHGVSMSVIDKVTSTEWRLSWIGLDQSLYDRGEFDGSGNSDLGPYDLHQKSNTLFAGVAWQVSPRLRSRLTHMASVLKAQCKWRGAVDTPCQYRFEKASTLLELGYQLNAKDVISLALSTYPVKDKGNYEWRHHSASLGWRRDWEAGWYGAVQLAWSRNRVPYSNWTEVVPAGSASAWGAGVRIGYKM